MPKEAAHWILAERTWEAMHTGPLKEEIGRYKALYDLGAVIFDTPFYYIAGKDREKLDNAARRLHGHQAASPFNPFLPLAQSPDDLPDGYRPFLAGAFTHIAADATFHPFVYHLSGSDTDGSPDRAAQATARHRRIESALDLHLFNRNGSFRGLRLLGLYRRREIGTKELLKLMNLLYFGKRFVSEASLRRALRQHGLVQSLLHQPWAHRLMLLLNAWFTHHYDPLEALFYATCTQPDPGLFQRPLIYRHPVTGEERRESVADLEARTVSLALGFLRILDEARHPDDLKKRLADAAFPSLYHGLPPDGRQKMRFFDRTQPLDI